MEFELRFVDLLSEGEEGEEGNEMVLGSVGFQEKLLLTEDMCHTLAVTQWIRQRETRNFGRVMKTCLFSPLPARGLQGERASAWQDASCPGLWTRGPAPFARTGPGPWRAPWW